MSEGPSSFPPPGAPAPGEGFPPPGSAPSWPPAPGAPAQGAPAPGPGTLPPGWAPYAGQQGTTPAPGLFLGAAHKPGAFPLRPLGLGGIWDGAFKIIRFNPKATVGAAVMVTSIALLVPVALTAVLTFTVGVSIDASGDYDPASGTGETLGALVAYFSLLAGIVLAQAGITLVTGMAAHVTHAAAVGRRLGLGEAWAATRGRRWRLVGLTVLIQLVMVAMLVLYVLAWVALVALGTGTGLLVVWGLTSVPAFLFGFAFVYTRLLYLPVPALMLEKQGVFAALGRSWRLTRGHGWRTFGIGILSVLVAGIAGSLLSAPLNLLGLVGGLTPEYAGLIFIASQSLALIVQNAFTAPFVATVSSVQYIDLRMRTEAYDVELLREAGVVPR